ncbi:MAG: glycosyltransferase, partial [Firmicutes bacterium]|nr:glycosyltransferase [Bacillota bacterium]
DLEAFDADRERAAFPDPDLDDPASFKVVYAGAIRQVNDLSILVDTAETLQKRGRSGIRLLLFGDGDQRAALEEDARKRGLTNIVFKGKVPKSAIPYVLSKADVCLLHWKPTPISKFGMSMNKQFDYFASGKPVLASAKTAYDLIERYGCGVAQNLTTADAYADAICRLADMEPEALRAYGDRARTAAEAYDFKNLTETLLRVMAL